MNARITTSLTLTALSSLLLSADAIGAKLRVPDQFATIQAAVDAANPGDVVEIEEGTYVETVDIVNKVDLTLRGDGKVVVDGGGAADDVFYVQTSDTVRFEDLVIRNASRGVHVFFSQNVDVEDVLVRNTTLTAIWFELSASCRVVDSKIVDAGTNGVAATQSVACHVEETVIVRPATNGIQMTGSMHTVADCEIVDSQGFGIRLGAPGEPAESVLVIDNVIENPVNDGLLVGNLSVSCSILDNVIKDGADDGIDVASQSDGHLIHDNAVRKVAGHGLEMDGADLIVSSNRVKRAGATGLRIEDEGDGGLYHENKIKRSGADGVEVFGSGNAFHQNKVKKSVGLDLNDHMAPGQNVYAGNSFGTTN